MAGAKMEFSGNPESVNLAKSWVDQLGLKIDRIENTPSGLQTNVYVIWDDVQITLEIYNTGTTNVEGRDSKQKIEFLSLRIRDDNKIKEIKERYNQTKKKFDPISAKWKKS